MRIATVHWCLNTSRSSDLCARVKTLNWSKNPTWTSKQSEMVSSSEEIEKKITGHIRSHTVDKYENTRKQVFAIFPFEIRKRFNFSLGVPILFKLYIEKIN